MSVSGAGRGGSGSSSRLRRASHSPTAAATTKKSAPDLFPIITPSPYTHNDGDGRTPAATNIASPVKPSAGNSYPLSPVALRPTDEQPKRRCRSGLMSVFIFIAFVQVAVSCVMIWYIGWRATTDTANSLSAQLRTSALSDCLNQINFQFAQTLRAAHQLQFMTEARFPELATRLTITNETGWLADMSVLGSLYPRISRFGIANKQALMDCLARPTSLTPDAVLSSTGEVMVFVAEPSHVNQSTVDLLLYHPSPIHTTTVLPPYNYEGEILNSDTAQEIRVYMGTNYTNQSYVTSTRPFWVAAVAFALQGREGGWTDPFPSTPESFLALSAFSSVIDETTREVQWIAWVMISLSDFEPFFSSLPVGTHGRSYLVRPGGGCVVSSDSTLTAIMTNTTAEIDMFTSTDEWLQRLAPILLELGLITREPISVANATLVVPYTDATFEVPIHAHGAWYTMLAQMTANDTTGLPYTAVIVTKDSDFEGNVHDAIITTAWLSCVIGVAALVGSSILTSCVTRPLMRVVRFMERAVGVIAMPRGEAQRAQLARLCDDWSADTHTDNVIQTTAAGAGLMHEPESIASMKADKEAACHIGHCANVGRSLREVDLMHRAFGSMLYSLASYDELEAINQAKRAFIRYIFHEVRVPFNAIVLGIEQMQLDLKVHIRANPACAMLSSCLDTMSIVHEQGEVVSRILNDVLSMQKIEDGALALDISSFDVAKMIRVALHAFRVPCAEKRLKVERSLASLDEALEHVRDTIPVLHAHPTIRLGVPHEDGTVWHAHVEADPYRLRQALANFISNAIKFSRMDSSISVHLEFGPFEPALRSSMPGNLLLSGNAANSRLSIDAEAAAATTPAPQASSGVVSPPEPDAAEAEDESDLFDADVEYSGCFLGCVAMTIRVRDSGVGLSAENASRMFQQYAQVSANKNQSGGGTGLGLSISKSIVELHGGGIGVTSEEGVGSEFFFTIPNTRVVLAKVDGHSSVAGDDTRSRSLSDESKSKSTSHTSQSSNSGVAPATRVAGTTPAFGPRAASAAAVISRRGTPLANPLLLLSHEQPAVVPTAVIPASAPVTTTTTNATLAPSPSALVIHPDEIDTEIVTVRFHQDPLAADGDKDAEHLAEAHIDDPTSSNGVATEPISIRRRRSLSPLSGSSAHSDQPPSLTYAQSILSRTHSSTMSTRGLGFDSQSLLASDGSSTTSSIPTTAESSAASTPSMQMTHLSPRIGGGGNKRLDLASSMPSFHRRIISGTHVPITDSPLNRPRMMSPNNAATVGAAAATSIPSAAATNTAVDTSPAQHTTAVADSTAPHADSKRHESKHRAVSTHSSRSSRAAPIRAGARVLVVEDSLPNRKLLISILTHMKLIAVGVENGQECVDLFPVATDAASTERPAEPFDVCIMDGNMPVMNGIDACRILRARGVSIPILALTGNALAEDVTAFIDAGATSVLTKPINRAQLLQALTLHLPASATTKANNKR